MKNEHWPLILKHIDDMLLHGTARLERLIRPHGKSWLREVYEEAAEKRCRCYDAPLGTYGASHCWPAMVGQRVCRLCGQTV